ncbi:MAG: restriction endonuclease subunit S [Salinivirgaceae bacterium]|jgi:type I restriction enzyme S subunit|nr:restriction endonuclease subunit S [Salinivirgaceae bacterium]
MEVKPGYKQTEVGIIPEEWEVRKIGEMFRLINGCAFKPGDWKQHGIPIIRIQNLNDPSAEFNFSQATVPERNRVEAGDLLFAWSGTLGSSFGARVWDGPSGVLNQHIFKVLMDEQQIALPYSLLVFARVEEDIAKQAHGFKASFVHVKKSDLVKVDLPLPPLPEQRAIAEALSDVDGLLGGLDRLIAKKRDLKQAAMQQLLTGQTRLPGFRSEWEVKQISDVCWFQEGPGVRNTQFTSTGVKLLNGTNIFRGRINLDTTDRFISETEAHGAYAHFLAESGDIVIACSGISVEKFHEKVAVVTLSHLPFCMNTSTMRFKPHQEHLVRDYLCHFLMGDSFKRQIAPQATGSAQLNFGPSHVEKVELPVPPLPEQTAIASVLTEMDGELAVLEQRREKTRALKLAMMQELLTGRTRLI